MANIPVYKIVSEYDIGEDGLIFATEELAKRWLQENMVLQELLEEDNTEDNSVEGWLRLGLLDIEGWELVT